jgi:hypothetical protein
MKRIIVLAMLLSVGCGASESKPSDVIGGELKCTPLYQITEFGRDLGMLIDPVSYMKCNDGTERLGVGSYLLETYGLKTSGWDTVRVVLFKGVRIGSLWRALQPDPTIPVRFELRELCTLSFAKTCDVIVSPLEIRLK